MLRNNSSIEAFIGSLDIGCLDVDPYKVVKHMLESNIDCVQPTIRYFFLWWIWDPLQDLDFIPGLDVHAHHAALVHRYKYGELFVGVLTIIDLPPIMGDVGGSTRVGIERLIGAYVGRYPTREEVIQYVLDQ